MRIPISIFLVFNIITTGCSFFPDSPPDGSTSLELRELGNMKFGADLASCDKNCYTKLTSKIDTTYIINDIQGYEKLIMKASCLEVANWPDIDFSKNTLLAGVIISPSSCATLYRGDLVLNPFDMKYKFIVTVQPGPSQAFSAVFFWALTDKLPADSDISFEIRYNSIQ